ncbi:MAG: hypothetical protein JWR33_2252 [Naasia sp.]|jgi:hypothetical protein|uniref:hypothetical protein n=1 Tax=Naasia sp. TaxID=2546198 RepID=UPI002605A4B7|nr:hypothetical protein [Naasia sp.]MCU1571511.1 hypothetical protein [Naasia sp.]
MRIVSYADEHFRTSDDVASAVLRYSMLLAHGDTSDVVRVPVVVDGHETWAELIIGPASQITTLEVVGDEDFPLDDKAVIQDLAQRADRVEITLKSVKAQVLTEDELAAAVPDVDYLEG